MRIRILRAPPSMIAAAIVGMILGGALGPAAADEPPSATDKAMAEVLFRDGKALFDQGKLDEACPKLAESHRIEPKPGTILNLALCHEQQGKTATAWAELMEAASMAGRAKQADRAKFARERMAAVEARLSKIKIEVAAPAAGILVKLDDRALAPAVWASAIPVDPGDHEVVASAPGRTLWSAKLTIVEGPSTHEVMIPELARIGGEGGTAAVAPSAGAASTSPQAAPSAAPKAPPAQGPSAPATSTASSTGLRPGMMASFTAGTVGVAGVVVGSIYGLRTLWDKSDGDAACDGRYCSPEGLGLHARAETSATISTIGFGVGIAGIGAGIALFILSRPSKTSKSPPPEASATRVWIAPAIVPGGGPSLAAGGVF